MMQQVASRLSPSTLSWMIAGTAIVVLAAAGPAWMTCERLTPAAVTDALRAARGFHVALIAIGTVLAFVTFAALLLSILAARVVPRCDTAAVTRRRGARGELLWALVPIVIVVAAATPAIAEFAAPSGLPAAAENPGYQCHFLSGL